jgi:hypothetical protein
MAISTLRWAGLQSVNFDKSEMVVQIESPSDLTEDIIIQKLRAAGGAHAPTGYEFSNYSS